jgi:hypothetical protein
MSPWASLRRRRKLEPVPRRAARPPTAPPPASTPLSRRWATQPIAASFVDWAAAEHYCGFGAGFCGVWHADDPLTPLDRFAIGPAGVLRPQPPAAPARADPAARRRAACPARG